MLIYGQYSTIQKLTINLTNLLFIIPNNLLKYLNNTDDASDANKYKLSWMKNDVKSEKSKFKNQTYSDINGGT